MLDMPFLIVTGPRKGPGEGNIMDDKWIVWWMSIRYRVVATLLGGMGLSWLFRKMQKMGMKERNSSQLRKDKKVHVLHVVLSYMRLLTR